MAAAATQPQTGSASAPASWHLYMPGVEYDPGERRAVLVTDLLRALGGREGWQLLRRVRAYQPQASPAHAPAWLSPAPGRRMRGASMWARRWTAARRADATCTCWRAYWC
jgi:hypothetical protein